MSVFPAEFRDCVVAIGVRREDEETNWIGTGFFYGYMCMEQEKEGMYLTYLVTNKHVLKDLQEIVIRCNPKGSGEAKEFTLPLVATGKGPTWLGHPNPNVDVAVLPVSFGGLKEQGLEVEMFRSNSASAGVNDLRKQAITEGDGVFVFGFPMAMIGPVRSAAIVRGGIIASIQELYAGLSDAFLVDAFVYPGNSGGPVVLRPELASIKGTPPHTKSLLIGVVAGYVPYKEIAVSVQTQEPRVEFTENSGLSVVFPVDAIDEIAKQHYDLMPELPGSTKEKLYSGELQKLELIEGELKD